MGICFPGLLHYRVVEMILWKEKTFQGISRKDDKNGKAYLLDGDKRLEPDTAEVLSFLYVAIHT